MVPRYYFRLYYDLFIGRDVITVIKGMSYEKCVLLTMVKWELFKYFTHAPWPGRMYTLREFCSISVIALVQVGLLPMQCWTWPLSDFKALKLAFKKNVAWHKKIRLDSYFLLSVTFFNNYHATSLLSTEESGTLFTIVKSRTLSESLLCSVRRALLLQLPVFLQASALGPRGIILIKILIFQLCIHKTYL